VQQNLISLGVILLLVVVVFWIIAMVVPLRTEFVIERPGRYQSTLEDYRFAATRFARTSLRSAMATFQQAQKKTGGTGDQPEIHLAN
jgi:regulator of protease activity HflC (stomatin/prohibitin superfamily)